MENQKKENVKVEIKKDEFKSSFELTPEEVKSLPLVLCQVEHRINKSGRSSYGLTIRFDGKDFNYKKQVDYRDFSEAHYNHFIRKNKLDPKKPQHVIKLPIRFIRGVNTLGRTYNQYQLFLSDKITITGFLKFFDLSELEDIGYKINWIERSEAIDLELDLEF